MGHSRQPESNDNVSQPAEARVLLGFHIFLRPVGTTVSPFGLSCCAARAKEPGPETPAHSQDLGFFLGGGFFRLTFIFGVHSTGYMNRFLWD